MVCDGTWIRLAVPGPVQNQKLQCRMVMCFHSLLDSSLIVKRVCQLELGGHFLLLRVALFWQYFLGLLIVFFLRWPSKLQFPIQITKHCAFSESLLSKYSFLASTLRVILSKAAAVFSDHQTNTMSLLPLLDQEHSVLFLRAFFVSSVWPISLCIRRLLVYKRASTSASLDPRRLLLVPAWFSEATVALLLM